MRLVVALCLLSSSVGADNSSLSLALPSPPMNYQSDSFSTGSMRCSNAVGGGVNLEYGVTGVSVWFRYNEPWQRHRRIRTYCYTTRQAQGSY